MTATLLHTLVSPAPDPGYSVPQASSDMNRTGTADAHSAPMHVCVPPNAPPRANAGGPYAGNEGGTILLDADGIGPVHGRVLRPGPRRSRGRARDRGCHRGGAHRERPAAVLGLNLSATITADFRLAVAGEKGTR